jgi:hypothetical protein
MLAKDTGDARQNPYLCLDMGISAEKHEWETSTANAVTTPIHRHKIVTKETM